MLTLGAGVMAGPSCAFAAPNNPAAKAQKANLPAIAKSQFPGNEPNDSIKTATLQSTSEGEERVRRGPLEQERQQLPDLTTAQRARDRGRI